MTSTTLLLVAAITLLTIAVLARHLYARFQDSTKRRSDNPEPEAFFPWSNSDCYFLRSCTAQVGGACLR